MSAPYAVGNCRCGGPFIEEPFHAIRNWDRSNVTALSNEVHDGPMILTALKVIESEIGQFPPSKTTAEQDGDNRTKSCFRPPGLSTLGFSSHVHPPPTRLGRRMRTKRYG